MAWFHALIIGLLQGLTEFLPISSSAHLKLAKLLLGAPVEESPIFDLACHLGTLVVLFYFLRHEIQRIFTQDKRQMYLIVIATLPLIPCYFLLKPLRDLAMQTELLGFFLMGTGLILFLGGKIALQRKATKDVRDVLFIGTMQSMALFPGISRSASTISAARIFGWPIKDAVRFSFLLSIPTILGGNCLELLKLYLTKTQAHPLPPLSTCMIGFLASSGMGFLLFGYAMRILEKGDLRPFAWYCLTLGLCISIYFNWI